MNNTQTTKQGRVFHALSDAGLILVQPGFPVEQRTVFGLCGEDSDLAISFKWHDAAGCEWEADFTEESLMNASMTQNRIMLNDSEGENVSIELYELTLNNFGMTNASNK
jgi:hypothetical protein